MADKDTMEIFFDSLLISNDEEGLDEMRKMLYEETVNQSNEGLIGFLSYYAKRMKEEYSRRGISRMNQDLEDARRIIDILWIRHLVSRG